MRKACLFSAETWPRIEHLIFRRPPLASPDKHIRAALLLLTTAVFLQAAPHQEFQTAYGNPQLAFEENRGQAPAGVRYLSRTGSGTVFLRPGSVALELDGNKTIAMRFVGAASDAPAGENILPGRTSYLVGDKADWITGISNYASVRYASVYPGIDAVFHGNQKQLEYDFVLSSGADPDKIRIAFEGVNRVFIDPQGNLELRAAHGTMMQRKPKIWQAGPHGRRELAGRYVLSGAAEARFVVDRYDRRNTLVIDPVIEYSTYFGSDRDDRALAVTTDSTGAAYIAGSTATGGVSWGFVSKVNASGTAVLYTVFFGSGVCNAAARGIAVDSGNNAIVTGYYTQKDASGACNVKQVYGAKLNPAGDAFVYQLVWGGNQDYGNAVAVDGSGNAYFTGSTNGSFPTTAGVIFPTGWLEPSGTPGKDTFITKLGPTGVRVYSTYLGGSLIDEGLAIAVDTSGNAYVAGSTNSADFPKTANAVQATVPNSSVTGFITKVNNTATQILYSTFLGGNRDEKVYGIALDAQGKIHVVGTTTSTDFPTTPNAWDRTCGADVACYAYYGGAWHSAEDVFYSKIDPLTAGMSGLMYSSFLGGDSPDFGEAIALDKNGRAWITGRTASGADFPKVHPAQETIGGNDDAFIAQFDPAQSGAASLVFSSFLGGGLYDEGAGVHVDSPGNIYVVGYTGSTNFPVVTPLQPTSAGGNEGFVVKIAAPAGLASVGLNPATVTGGANSTGTVTLTTTAPVGGAVVTLTSSNLNAATVPASVTIAAGATTAAFVITTKPVTTQTAVTITTIYRGAAKATTLLVNPPGLLASVTLTPVSVTGGVGSTGTVKLAAAAPAGGAVVTLTSSNLNAATVPASVTVAAGATTAAFPITTKPVTTQTAVIITATYKGAAKSATLTMNAHEALAGIALNPATIIFGSSSTGTVTLTSAAPAGGAVITLSSSDWTNFYLPASVMVPAGATSAKFTVTTAIGKSTTTITASYSGVNKTANLASVYPTVNALACGPNPVIAGNTAICTVTLNGIMPAATTVWILSDEPFFAPASGTVTVAAGATSTAFSITTTLVPNRIVAHISASALATATVTAPLTIDLTNRGRKWVLNNVVFKDGGKASGYFTYDSATGKYLDANILVTPGPDPLNPMGQPPENLYYYPWPNGFHPTFVDNWTTASLLSLQNPIGGDTTPPAWTLLQLNFVQPLTNAGGTVGLVTDPNVAYTSHCTINPSPLCTPPPANISQEFFGLPPLPGYTVGSYYFRVIISGTVVAQ